MNNTFLDLFKKHLENQKIQNEILIAIYREFVSKKAPELESEVTARQLNVDNSQIKKLLKKQSGKLQ